MKTIQLVQSADPDRFEDEITKLRKEYFSHGLDTEIQYHPVVVNDESEYVLYTALVIGKRIS